MCSVISMFQELLVIYEKMVRDNKKIETGFNTLFKRKLIEKANQYDFLDPFIAEFQYFDGKIAFAGAADDKQLAGGVIESMKELADDLGMLEKLRGELTNCTQEYFKELEDFAISF